MKTMRTIALPDLPTSRIPFPVKTARAELLRTASKKMAKILSARGLCVRITLDGTSILIGNESSPDKSAVEFVFDSEIELHRLLGRMRLIEFATAYFDGRMRIKGSISKAIEILDAINVSTDQRQSIAEYFKGLVFRMAKALSTTKALNFESLDHYAQSAQAYELFLDNYMQYTCGHFKIGNEDINQAQIAKFHLIEEMVSKHAGPLAGKDHLDIGAGWGGMANFFANTFGTRSVGNTNCPEQMEYAHRRYGCEVILDDFSQLKSSERRFDLITIVGMIEHLTPYRRLQLLDVVHHTLKKDGVVYLQCIAKPPTWIGGDAYRVTQRDVFPGHFLETPEQTESRLRRCGFTILEQSDDCLDYGLTASRWVENIQRNEAALITILGAQRYRMYLGYLGYASMMFSSGRGSLMRYLLKKA